MGVAKAQPGKFRAAIFALAVHLVFIALLIFGVNWQNEEPPAVQVELWKNLPAVEAPSQPPPRPEKPAPLPEPEPIAQPKLKPVPEEELPQPKPDIALKQELKKEEEKRKAELAEKRREEKQKLEEERKKLAEEKLKERKLKEEEQRRILEAKRLEEKRLAEARREEALQAAQEKLQVARIREAQLAALAQQETASANQGLINDYTNRIRSKIRRFIILPHDMTGNPQAEFDVTLMPTGDVLNVVLARTSGNPAYDRAVERAIYKAQPLPLPPQPELFSRFRELRLKFRPHDEG